MATCLSHHPLCFSPLPRPIATPTPSRSLKTLTLALPPVRRNPSAKSRPAPGTLSSSSQAPRRTVTASSKLAESDSKIINGDEVNENQESATDNVAGKKDAHYMKALIQSYKTAILDGDEKSVCELEATICTMENEKNDLSQKYAEIRTETASGKDKCLRLQADFENFRKRSEKDHITFTSDIQGEVVERLLPMVDSFERAKQQLKPETEKEKKIYTSYQGIYKQFVEIVRSLRVVVVETVGKPFDPSIHEAVGREGSHQFREGIVMQELRRGFVLGGRILRPAAVKVSTGPGHGRAPSSSEESAERPEEAAESVEDSVPTSSGS